MFFQTVVFRNLFRITMDPLVEAVLLPLLKDPQLEIREACAQIVSGLLRCSTISLDTILPFVRRWIRKPKGQFRKGDFGTEKEYSEALIIRHAGVLTLSSIILAFPYSLPDFLPDLLVQLIGHLSDPNPIQATVKKSISEFRRTHQDRWHDHVKQFNPEQLEIVSEVLISPSYYV